MLVLQCWCCYALPHVPLWFQYLSIWEKHNGNCVINTNGHKSSLFYDGIKQNKTSSVKHLEKKTYIQFYTQYHYCVYEGNSGSTENVKMHWLYVEFMHYRFLISLWMKPPCCWHTVMTVTVPFNEITGMGRHYLWCVLQTRFFCNPCTGLDRPLGFPGGWGCQISRQLAHEGEQVFSPMHWLSLLTRRYSWYSFLLQAELTPGSECGWKDVNKKFQWHRRESNPWPSSL